MDYRSKQAIARNGTLLQELRQAVDSNDEGKIKQVMDQLDQHQKQLADIANAASQQQPGGAKGATQDVSAGQRETEPTQQQQPQQPQGQSRQR